VSMHGVSSALLEAQAGSLGLSLMEVKIPADCSNEVYDQRMLAAMTECSARGIDHIAFGDIFLQDVRRYREEKLAQVAMQAVFPLWGLDSRHLALDFLSLDFRGVVACVDLRVLDPSFAGRELDERFLADLPPGVDPCGENGEFHSFVYDGPNLCLPLIVEVGDRVERSGFVFADLRLRDRPTNKRRPG
jgi:diphthamide synthase (EF-2-diphthine--ammonia ligase)